MSDDQGLFQANPNRDDYQPDRLLDHEFDGIQEFDNKLPNWWQWIMWGSIVFSLLYWLVFHTLTIEPLPRERFVIEMTAAQEAELARMAESGLSNELLLQMSQMDSKLAEGQEIWTKHCVACHKERGEGLVGPNLTDGFWVHGCQPMDMLGVVTNGVAAKGMPAWQNQLGPSRVQAVVAFTLTLRGTDIAGKAPEGEPCEF
jgi:cytochrome c oxidase cbb3-type subunit 3